MCVWRGLEEAGELVHLHTNKKLTEEKLEEREKYSPGLGVWKF